MSSKRHGPSQSRFNAPITKSLPHLAGGYKEGQMAKGKKTETKDEMKKKDEGKKMPFGKKKKGKK